MSSNLLSNKHRDINDLFHKRANTSRKTSVMLVNEEGSSFTSRQQLIKEVIREGRNLGRKSDLLYLNHTNTQSLKQLHNPDIKLS